MTSDLAIGITFVAYLLVIFVLGWKAFQRTKNASDYFL